MRKIIEETLEAEVSDALGRGYYENGAEPGRGYRNGYRRARLRTSGEESLTLANIRGCEAFVAALRRLILPAWSRRSRRLPGIP